MHGFLIVVFLRFFPRRERRWWRSSCEQNALPKRAAAAALKHEFEIIVECVLRGLSARCVYIRHSSIPKWLRSICLDESRETVFMQNVESIEFPYACLSVDPLYTPLLIYNGHY